jgi:hypothetical protein
MGAFGASKRFLWAAVTPLQKGEGHNSRLTKEQAYETHTKRHRRWRVGDLCRSAGDGRRCPRRHGKSNNDASDNDNDAHHTDDNGADERSAPAGAAQSVLRDDPQPAGPLHLGTGFGVQS